jgi:hypothetical protein
VGKGHFLRWIVAYVVNITFEGILFLSDSRHNDRVDNLWECRPPSVVLLSESHAIINDLDVIVHGFMLQIIFCLAYLMPSTLQGLYRAPEKLGYMSIPQCAQCDLTLALLLFSFIVFQLTVLISSLLNRR